MKLFIRDSLKWSISIGILTFFSGVFFTVLSTSLLVGVTWGVGMLIVLFFVLFGIIFDIIGLAAASADEIPFRAMASERIRGAKQGIHIVRNAAKVSSFCNDVIGDISGIVSGTGTTYVVLQIAIQFGIREGSIIHTATAVILTAIVAALTVGGKAFGKAFSIKYSTQIVLFVGKLLYILEEKLKIRILTNEKSKKKPNGKGRR